MSIISTATTEPVRRDPDSPVRLAVLGATGSIGRQTIDLVKAHPHRFVVTALAVNRRIDEAIDICMAVHPRVLVVCDPDYGREAVVRMRALDPSVEVIVGAKGMEDIVVRDDVDMVVTATVGYSGLLPTLAAIAAGKDIALANKETLVVGGDYIRGVLATSKTRIFPVDSEHSAIAQCLRGEDPTSVERLIITASGGPFRTLDADALERVTAADALRHPNWNMGAKITIDSASLMNKAFEIIEAHYLFGIPADRIRAVVHPQSIVHSMVEFTDGAIKAQLGVPDMHLPIAYALGLNNRIAGASPRLSLADMSRLTFEEPDTSKFPCLGYATLALERRGNTACVINAANEVAVSAFLAGHIRFTDIPRIIDTTLDAVDFVTNPGPDDFIATNALSRDVAAEAISQL